MSFPLSEPFTSEMETTREQRMKDEAMFGKVFSDDS